MIRWNWKWYVLKEAVENYCLWVPETDDPGDIIGWLMLKIHHMMCKAQIIRRAHR